MKHPWLKKPMSEGIMESRRHRVTVAEAEQVQLFEGDWSAIKSQMRDEDELWYFCTPDETWTETVPRCGLEGYVLVRDGKFVDSVLTSIS